VDPAEVAKFNKLSEEWWSVNSQYKALRSMNGIRVPLVASTLHKNGEKKRVLDIGCGGGLLSEGLAEHFHNLGMKDEEIEIVGIDPGNESVLVAQNHLPERLRGKVTYVCSTIEDYVATNPSAQFDTVVMSEVIEHVENPEEFLKHAISVTKPGGSIILSTPGKTFLSWLGVIILSEYVLRIVPIGTHEYKKFIAIDAMQQLFKKYECEIKDVKGAFYNPITDRWSWNNCCKSICYAIHARKRNHDEAS